MRCSQLASRRQRVTDRDRGSRHLRPRTPPHGTVIKRLGIALAVALLVARRPRNNRPAGWLPVGITREIAPVEARVEAPTVERIRGVVFTMGTIDGTRIVTARVGVGKVNAAVAATLLLDHFAPEGRDFLGHSRRHRPRSQSRRRGRRGTAVGHHDFGTATAAAFVLGTNPDRGHRTARPAVFSGRIGTARRRTTSGRHRQTGAVARRRTRPGPENHRGRDRDGRLLHVELRRCAMTCAAS